MHTVYCNALLADDLFARLRTLAPHAARPLPQNPPCPYVWVGGGTWVCDAFAETLALDPEPGVAYRWRYRNSITGLIGSENGVFLMPAGRIGEGRLMPAVVSELRFTTAWDAWKAGFREAARRAHDLAAVTPWLERGLDRPLGAYAVAGARSGFSYRRANPHPAARDRLNDRAWLYGRFLAATRNAQAVLSLCRLPVADCIGMAATRCLLSETRA